MKDMRAVAVDEDAVLVVFVIGVARDMGPRLDDEHTAAPDAGETFSEDASGVARPNDQIIETLHSD